MKRSTPNKTLSAITIAALLLLSSCNNNNVVAEGTNSGNLINVTKEGLGYEINAEQYSEEITTAVNEQSSETVVVSDDTSETTTVTKEKEIPKLKPQKETPEEPTYYNVVQKTEEQENKKEEDEITFGKIKLSYEKDGIRTFDANDSYANVNYDDFLQDIDYTDPDSISKQIEEAIKKAQESSTYTPPVSQSNDYILRTFGENPYAAWTGSIGMFGEEDLQSSITKYHDDLLEQDYCDEYDIDIEKSDILSQDFKFRGIGHYLRNSNTDNETAFYLELEQDGKIINPRKALKIKSTLSTSTKAVMVKLGDFNTLTSTGYAKTTPQIKLTFIADKNGETFDIDIGMPYITLQEFMGDGILLTEKVENEDSSITNNDYYVYPTNDYTLMIHKQKYPDIEKPPVYSEELSDKDVELVDMIILIDNETKSFEDSIITVSTSSTEAPNEEPISSDETTETTA